MKMFTKIFFLKGPKGIDLETKWWHRFFVVLFIILVIVIFFSSLLMTSEVIPETIYNVNIQYNLRDFTKNSSPEIIDTIPAFISLNYKIGCLDGNRIDYFWISDLNKCICSSDLRGNIDNIALLVSQKNVEYSNVSKSKMIAALTDTLNKEAETRYCFIVNSVKCSSDKIVAYRRNIIFYLEMFFASLILTYMVGLFVQFVYFKGLIFIIYGNKK